MSDYTLHHGDCMDVMRDMPQSSVDTIITDPPYGLSFMGKQWDHGVPGVPFWDAALRVAKPGAFLLAFGGTRTYHRLTCAIEDAGWEIRDCMMWLYGSGFPKSHDISKGIDKAAGAEQDRAFRCTNPADRPYTHTAGETSTGWQSPVRPDKTAPATDLAKQWDGWGTALKPAHEIIIKCQKPLPFAEELRTIIGNLSLLEARLWSLLPVNIAESCFKLSPQEHARVCDSAQWSADERCNTWDGLFDQMDTSPCVSVMTTSLNIVRLWLTTLTDHYNGMNTSTTATDRNQTIDWRTLKSCSLVLTPQSIIEEELRAPGCELNALPAALYLNAVVANISSTHTLSALASATSSALDSHPVADGETMTPAWEPIIVAMKPLDGTFAHNAEAHGVAGLHIDAGRIGTDDTIEQTGETVDTKCHTGYDRPNATMFRTGKPKERGGPSNTLGRWPANVLFDEESGAMLGEPARFFYSSKAPKSERWVYLTCDCETVNFNTWENEDQSHSEPTECTSPPKDISEATLTDGLRSNTPTYGSQKTDQSHLDFTSTTPTETSKTTESKTYDSSALPNTNGSTQDANCETENGGNPAESVKGCSPSTEPISIYRQKDGPCTGVVVPAISPLSSMPGRCVECGATVRKTSHPTQKPVELLRYLCKLTATPTGGTVLDPFMGSGSTGVACVKEGRSFVGIELDEGYVDIARQRIEHARTHPTHRRTHERRRWPYQPSSNRRYRVARARTRA